MSACYIADQNEESWGDPHCPLLDKIVERDECMRDSRTLFSRSKFVFANVGNDGTPSDPVVVITSTGRFPLHARTRVCPHRGGMDDAHCDGLVTTMMPSNQESAYKR